MVPQPLPRVPCPLCPPIRRLLLVAGGLGMALFTGLFAIATSRYYTTSTPSRTEAHAYPLSPTYTYLYTLSPTYTYLPICIHPFHRALRHRHLQVRRHRHTFPFTIQTTLHRHTDVPPSSSLSLPAPFRFLTPPPPPPASAGYASNSLFDYQSDPYAIHRTEPHIPTHVSLTHTSLHIYLALLCV